VRTRDKAAIESFLKQNTPLHIYEIGDLDDFFWPDTRWYGSRDGDSIDSVALLYVGMEIPTLIALADDDTTEAMRELLVSVSPTLPNRFDAHLTNGLADALRPEFDLRSRGKHFKMVLNPGRFREYVSQMDTAAGVPATDSTGITVQPSPMIVHLADDDLPEIERFYREAYPSNWFDPRMLATNRYYGVRVDDRLVAVAGVHVYSPRYRVAALGNVATLPSHRGYGYGSRATAHLCARLMEEGLVVGLNVRADNAAAIKSYRRIGFTVVAEYDEYELHEM
jgi:RimJ/RimL family protein N-acetyltransferase